MTEARDRRWRRRAFSGELEWERWSERGGETRGARVSGREGSDQGRPYRLGGAGGWPTTRRAAPCRRARVTASGRRTMTGWAGPGRTVHSRPSALSGRTFPFSFSISILLPVLLIVRLLVDFCKMQMWPI